MGKWKFDLAPLAIADEAGRAAVQAVESPVADTLAAPHEAGLATLLDHDAAEGRPGDDARRGS